MPPQKRGDGAQEQIVALGQMLISVSGHHPILGTQSCWNCDFDDSKRYSVTH